MPHRGILRFMYRATFKEWCVYDCTLEYLSAEKTAQHLSRNYTIENGNYATLVEPYCDKILLLAVARPLVKLGKGGARVFKHHDFNAAMAYAIESGYRLLDFIEYQPASTYSGETYHLHFVNALRNMDVTKIIRIHKIDLV